jgi:hypothetical protein
MEHILAAIRGRLSHFIKKQMRPIRNDLHREADGQKLLTAVTMLDTVLFNARGRAKASEQVLCLTVPK